MSTCPKDCLHYCPTGCNEKYFTKEEWGKQFASFHETFVMFDEVTRKFDGCADKCRQVCLPKEEIDAKINDWFNANVVNNSSVNQIIDQKIDNFFTNTAPSLFITKTELDENYYTKPQVDEVLSSLNKLPTTINTLYGTTEPFMSTSMRSRTKYI